MQAYKQLLSNKIVNIINPSDLNPYIWYDFSDIESMDGTDIGEDVSYVVNKGTKGGDCDLTLRSGYDGPTLGQDSRGKYYLEFNGVNQLLQQVDAASRDDINFMHYYGEGNGFTAFLYGNATRINSYYIAENNTSSGWAGISYYHGSTSQGMRIYSGREMSGANQLTGFSSGGNFLNQDCLSVVRRSDDSNSVHLEVNNVNYGSYTINEGPNSNSARAIHVGAGTATNPVGYFEGNIYNIIIFDRLLTEDEITGVKNWLRNEYTENDDDNYMEFYREDDGGTTGSQVHIRGPAGTLIYRPDGAEVGYISEDNGVYSTSGLDPQWFGLWRILWPAHPNNIACRVFGGGLTVVNSWGRFNSSSIDFAGSPNLTSVPHYLPESITSTVSMFSGCSSFNQNLGAWDVSNVTNMRSMFSQASSFNGHISNWNVQNVTDMWGMFNSASAFNQDLSDWCVELIPTQPPSFDQNATNWSAPRPNWGDVCRVEPTPTPTNPFPTPTPSVTPQPTPTGPYAHMMKVTVNTGELGILVYEGDTIHWSETDIEVVDNSGTTRTRSFSGPATVYIDYAGDPTLNLSEIAGTALIGLDRWGNHQHAGIRFYGQGAGGLGVSPNLTYVPSYLPSHITNLSSAFRGTTSFQQSLHTWDTSHVTSFGSMFAFSTYSGPIDFDFSSALYLDSMFRYAQRGFNIDAFANWETSSVVDMSFLFQGCSTLNSWIEFPTANVTNMANMFDGCTSFNRPLSFYTGNVTNMRDMFRGCTQFNQPIGGWNTSNVRNMQGMFQGARNFNQSLWMWNTSKVTNMDNMFNNAVSFNQSINFWCVELIPDQPEGFNTNTNPSWSWTNYPRWGQACL